MRLQKAELLQGTLDMLVLRTLASGALHGFAIVKRIRTLTDEVIQVGEGSLYPALYRLQEAGWIEAKWGRTAENRRAKFYRLTRKGRKRMEQEVRGWMRLSSAVSKVIQNA